MDYIPTIIVTVMVLGGIGAYTWAGVAYQRGRRSLAWPSVPGTITASSVNASTSTDSNGVIKTTYVAVVSYDYQLAGRTVTGSRIGVGGTTTTSQGAAARIAGQYATGTKVDIFYDPADPAYAVLVRGPNLRLVTVLAAGGTIAFAMAVFAAIFLRGFGA